MFAMMQDLSKCMGCKACQVACKSWNNLPGEKTVQRGTYQNPPDLEANTYTMMHYNEVVDEKGNVDWLFRKAQCFHCSKAACLDVCPAAGAIYRTKWGGVVIDQEKCIGCKYCINACPFSIPRFDAETGKATKCTMCYDRIEGNMIPACVKACPSHAMSFGDRDRIIAKARARAKELGGEATVYGDTYLGGTHFMYVLPQRSALYAGLPISPFYPMTVTLWRSVVRPFSLVAFLGAIGVSWLYFISRGPKKPLKEGQ